MDKIEKISRKLSNSMDNLFGLLSYSMIRNLATSEANKVLMSVISQSTLNHIIGYDLVRDSTQLNEFGMIAVGLVLNKYDNYRGQNTVFATKLLRLLVLDHYYISGYKDFKNIQKVWEKMKLGNKEKVLALHGNINQRILLFGEGSLIFKMQ